MAKRLTKGKGIRVSSVYFTEPGEIVRSLFDEYSKLRMYEIRLGPAHFIYLERKDFKLVDSIIRFDTLVKLKKTEDYW